MNLRFVIKFNNGLWKIFDHKYYTDVKAFGTRQEAVDCFEEKYNGSSTS